MWKEYIKTLVIVAQNSGVTKNREGGQKEIDIS